MLKKLFITVTMLLTLATVAWADNYEAVTVDNTAGGVALTAATYGRARYAILRLETAEIRYTKDGTTAPTDAVGVVVLPLEFIVLDNHDQIKNFRAIRTGGTSGVLHCLYMDN
jgi:hypothetical protein